MVTAAKAAYLASLVQAGERKIERFTDPMEVADWQIEQPFNTRLNKLKKSSPEAFFYWFHSIQLKAKQGQITNH